jgi:hypothetical protein
LGYEGSYLYKEWSDWKWDVVFELAEKYRNNDLPLRALGD